MRTTRIFRICLVSIKCWQQRSSAIFFLLILVLPTVVDLQSHLTQLVVWAFLHTLNNKRMTFASSPLIPVTVLGFGVVRKARQANVENVKTLAGKAPAFLPMVSPLAAASPARREQPAFTAPWQRGGHAGKKTGSGYMCLSPSILEKRSNSVLLSFDRTISFSGDSNLTVVV